VVAFLRAIPLLHKIKNPACAGFFINNE